MSVLGTEPLPSGRASSTLNCSAISPAPKVLNFRLCLCRFSSLKSSTLLTPMSHHSKLNRQHTHPPPQTPPLLLVHKGTAVLSSSSSHRCSARSISEGTGIELSSDPGFVPGLGSTKKHSCKCLVRDAGQSTDRFQTEWEGPGWRGWGTAAG